MFLCFAEQHLLSSSRGRRDVTLLGCSKTLSRRLLTYAAADEVSLYECTFVWQNKCKLAYCRTEKRKRKAESPPISH